MKLLNRLMKAWKLRRTTKQNFNEKKATRKARNVYILLNCHSIIKIANKTKTFITIPRCK